MAKAWNITADSTPVLDGWGWADYWSINDWIIWHKSMKSKYGQQEANRRFLAAWHTQDSDANPFNQRNFNSDFRKYARDNGFFDGLFSGMGFISKPIGWINDLFTTTDHVTAKAAGTIDNTVKGLENTGKIVKYALPIAAILIFLAGTFYLYQKVKK